MGLLAIAGIACAALAAVDVVGGISYWEWGLVPSVIIGLMLLAAYFVTVIMHGAIQKKHDLVSYREIVAFSKGDPNAASPTALADPAR